MTKVPVVQPDYLMWKYMFSYRRICCVEYPHEEIEELLQ